MEPAPTARIDEVSSVGLGPSGALVANLVGQKYGGSNRPATQERCP